jgi:hypothetical protein
MWAKYEVVRVTRREDCDADADANVEQSSEWSDRI